MGKSKAKQSKCSPTSSPATLPNISSSPWWRSEHFHISIEILIAFIIAWAYQYHLQFVTAHMPGTDGYYHIKISWLIRENGILKNFPWAPFSLWGESYFDKDFGFHLLLIPFTFIELVYGAKLAAATYGAFIFASFFAVLRLNRIRLTWIWFLLIIAGGGYFLWRVNVPRPQLISMSLTLWSIYFILKRSWLGTLIFGIVYALSYTAPQVVIVYAAIHFVVNRLYNDGWDNKLLAAAFGGVLLGSIIHPHFPNNFIAWKIQLVGVLANAWGVAGPNLFLGGELKPADTRSFLVEHLPIYLVFMGTCLSLPLLKKFISKNTLSLFVLANGYFIVTCLSKRFVEYFVPLSLWFCAMVVTELVESFEKNGWPKFWQSTKYRAIIIGTAAVLYVLLFIRSNEEINRNFHGPQASTAKEAALWLKDNTPHGAQVFTCDWDDAPELFFFNHQNKYMVFLDPNYLYGWKPDLWQTWFDVANGRHRTPVDTILTTFKAKYGYCTNNFSRLRKQLEKDSRVTIPLRTGNSFLFQIVDDTPAPEPAAYRFQISETVPFKPNADRKQQLTERHTHITWKEKTLKVHEGAYIDLAQATRVRDFACVNLKTELPMKKKRVKFFIRSDDDSAVWINDQMKYAYTGSRDIQAREDIFEFVLNSDYDRPHAQPEINILIRVCQDEGEWGLILNHKFYQE